MINSCAIVLGSSQKDAVAGSQKLREALGCAVARFDKAVFFQKNGSQTTQYGGASIMDPMVNCRFDKKLVDAVLNNDLKVAFIGSAGRQYFDEVPFKQNRDGLQLRFGTPYQHEAIDAKGGALGFLADRVSWVLKEHLRAVTAELWVMIYNVSSEHPRDYYVSLLAPSGVAMQLWPAVIGAMWTGAAAHPPIMSFAGLYMRANLPTVMYPA